MKFKKLTALSLSMMMIASVLAGCGNTGKEESEVSNSGQTETSQTESSVEASTVESTEEDETITFPLEEPIKYTGLMLTHKDAYPVKDNVAWNAFLEYGNIEVELTEIPRAEAGEKGNLIMAGGNYPDFLFKMSSLDLEQYGMDGILIPLEDLIKEYMPNLSALLDEREGWDDIAAADGHIYALPSVQTSLHYFGDQNYWINQKWLDDLGLSMPTDMESLYEVLKAFKENDPNGNGEADEIPYAFTGTNWARLADYVGDKTYYSPFGFAIAENGELVYNPYEESFYELLEWVTKMYEEGLLDQDAFTQTSEQLKAKGTAGKVFGMFQGSPTVYVPADDYMSYMPLVPFVPENMARSNGIFTKAFAITDKCENVETLCAWIDYLYSEEGGLLMWMGPEGETYEVNADGTYKWIWEGKYEDTAAFKMSGSANVPCLVTPFVYKNVEDFTSSAGNWTYQKWSDGPGGIYNMGGVIPPTIKYTEEEATIVSDLSTDIGGYISNYTAQVIVGEISLEDSWETFQSTLKAMGADEYISITKDAYERATAE